MSVTVVRGTSTDFHSSSGSNIASLTLPGGTVQYDTILLHIATVGSVPVLPSGYTQIAAFSMTSGSTYYVLIAYKIAGASETAPAPDCGGNTFIAGLTVVGGTYKTAPVNVSNSSTNIGNATSVSGAAISPTEGSRLFIFAGGGGASPRTTSGYAIATNDPGGWTELYDLSGVSGGIISSAAAHVGWANSGSTGNASATFSGTLTTQYIATVALIPDHQYMTLFGSASSIVAPVWKRTLFPVSLTVASSVRLLSLEAVPPVWSNVTKNIATWLNVNKS